MSDWKNNRPENWENPHKKVQMTYDEQQLEFAFEAGADAMLKSLRGIDTWVQIDKDGGFSISPAFSVHAWKKYRLVFIPEESKC